MPRMTFVQSGTYQDSVSLMRLSTLVSKLDGIKEATVMMSTPLNKAALDAAGMLTEVAKTSKNGDLLLVLDAEDEETAQKAFEVLQTALRSSEIGKNREENENEVSTIEEAIKSGEEFTLACISTPGEYAAAESLKALKKGMNVFLFSDNVTLHDEIKIKQYAHERNLLVMGPDCGTAFVSGTPVGFSHHLRRGNIGIVGASGTGMQEIMCRIEHYGGGISHALGTGSRDLHDEIHGISTLDAINCLENNEDTEVIVIVSKPPDKDIATEILNYASKIKKKAVVCFLGEKSGLISVPNVEFATTLEEAAIVAVEIALSKPIVREQFDLSPTKTRDNCYLRGLYSGGSLAYEAIEILQRKGLRVCSNIAGNSEDQLTNPHISMNHTVIDMGADAFTVGKPHPMIDYSSRISRIKAESLKEEVNVILLDVILGTGSHPDPASELAPIISQVKEKRPQLTFVVHICGSKDDPQNKHQQIDILKGAGAIVEESNISAVLRACNVLEGRQV